MAINISVYSNANSSSKSISFNFASDILAASDQPANAVSNSFYFKVTAGSTQDNGSSYPVKIIRGLDELVLNKQKQRMNDTANAYSSIKEMIVDYTYDYINGHSANLYGSECTEQKPMKF
jgi:hypothetical protein